jgi:hypothetical protein
LANISDQSGLEINLTDLRIIKIWIKLNHSVWTSGSDIWSVEKPWFLQTACLDTWSIPSIFSETSTSTLQLIRCPNIFKIYAIDYLIKLSIFYWKLTISSKSRWLNRHLHVLRNLSFNIIIIISILVRNIRFFSNK